MDRLQGKKAAPRAQQRSEQLFPGWQNWLHRAAEGENPSWKMDLL